MSDINAYTTAEIANLTPQSGDLVLNTDDNAVQLWNGSAWKIFNSDAAAPFNISTLDTEATILASSPTNPSGEVTVSYATDTKRLCVYDGASWVTYDNNFTI